MRANLVFNKKHTTMLQETKQFKLNWKKKQATHIENKHKHTQQFSRYKLKSDLYKVPPPKIRNKRQNLIRTNQQQNTIETTGRVCSRERQSCVGVGVNEWRHLTTCECQWVRERARELLTNTTSNSPLQYKASNVIFVPF